MSTKYLHSMIRVTDPDATVKFFNLIGLEEVRRIESEKGRFTLSPLSDLRSPQGGIWSHPVVVNGRLYLRDQDTLLCYDLRAK